MEKFNFKDWVVVNGVKKIVSGDSDLGYSVSDYFANVGCKRELIKKWIPENGEECFFIDDNNNFVIDLFEKETDNGFQCKKTHIIKNKDSVFEELNIFKYCEPYVCQTIPFHSLFTKVNTSEPIFIVS